MRYRMSGFSYNMASPPPTGGPLTIIERANQNTPYSGGGGGGGGSVVSSFATASISSLSVSSINGQVPGSGVSSFATASISSLSVSSINGQVPGSVTIPSNLNVSTLAAADSLSVGGGLPLGKGIVDIGNLPTSEDITMEILGYNSGTAALFGMSIVSDANKNTISISSVGATPILLNNISTINGAAYPPPGSSGTSITNNGAAVSVAPTGAISMTSGNTASLPDIQIGDNFTIGIGIGNSTGDSIGLFAGNITFASGNVVMTATNLNVSSINNAAYPPPGGSAAQYSTLFTGASTIACDPGAAILFGFSTTIGHTYQIQTQMNIQGNGGQEGTENDDVVQELAAELLLNTTQGSFISTANAAARDVNIGACGMWKASLASQSLTINGSFSTSVNMSRVALIDFGAI